MAVSYVTDNEAVNSAQVTTQSVALAAGGGSDRAALACTGSWDPTGTISGIAHDSAGDNDPMTEEITDVTGNNEAVSIFWYPNPDAGSVNYTATYNQAMVFIGMCVAAFDGCDQTEPALGGVSEENGDGSLTVSGAVADDQLIDSWYQYPPFSDQGISVGANQISRAELEGGGGSGYDSSSAVSTQLDPTADSGVMSWTIGTLSANVHAACYIQASGGAPAGGGLPSLPLLGVG